jgi:hypothetical protein
MLKIPKKKPPSHVTATSYNPATKELDVTFHGSRKYRYHDVTARQFAELSKHPSPGGFLHKHIIGKNDATKLDD